MEENKRLAAELELLKAELKKANEYRLKCDRLQVCLCVCICIYMHAYACRVMCTYLCIQGC
jgi:hypothetical protein